MKHPPVSIAILTVSLTLLAGCDSKQSAAEPAPSAGIPTTVTEVDPASLPPELLSVVTTAIPGMQVKEVERKEREGRVYFDVEGQRPDGSEVELDILQEGSSYQVVEIQRDIPWSEVPQIARDAASAGGLNFEPVRVIESTQTDNSVIFELFAEGKPDKPSKEVRIVDGKATVLTEEWKH